MAFTRIDSTSWLPGYTLIGDPGFGLPGSAVPSTGDDGPPPHYSLLNLPAEDNVEICIRLGTIPVGLTIWMDEDGVATASAADGTYVVPYTLYRDGVADGTPYDFALIFGAGSPGGTQYFGFRRDANSGFIVVHGKSALTKDGRIVMVI